MSARRKTLSKLYFQFVEGTEFEMHLTGEDVADCLFRAELIDYEGNSAMHIQTHYFETEKMRRIPRALFDETLRALLTQYIVDVKGDSLWADVRERMEE